uniref:Uncharacterized protein n=1 Tax=Panagrolaimus sp. PS1159 TaxID=55785 RepID=A0AC35EZJ4_9BILA
MCATFMASAFSTFMFYPRTPMKERERTVWAQFGMFLAILAIIGINFALSDFKHCSETERYMVYFFSGAFLFFFTFGLSFYMKYKDHETTEHYHYTALDYYIGTDQTRILINSGKKKIVIELPNMDSLNRKRSL